MSPPYRIDMLDGPEDLDAVQEVDRLSFPSPWTREMYEAELRQTGTAFIVVLRTASTPVAGYCSYRVVADELQVNNVAVRPDERGKGYGRALVEAALDHGRASGALTAHLEVRRSNLAARRLYLDLGFVQVGERQRYYTHPEEDALVLAQDVRILGRDPTA